MEVTSTRRIAPIGVECVVYLAFGMPVAMLGVAWPTLRDELGRADGDLGVLVLAYGVGRLVTSASSGPLLARLRFGLASAVTLIGLALSGVWVATSLSWSALVAAVAALGILSGVLDSLGARSLAVSGSVRRAGLAAGSYGVGATIGPVVIALTDSVAVGYLTGTVVALVAAAMVVALAIDWPPGLDAPPEVARPIAGEPLGVAELLHTPAVLVSLGLFAAFVSVEVTAGGWLATVLEDAGGPGLGLPAHRRQPGGDRPRGPDRGHRGRHRPQRPPRRPDRRLPHRRRPPPRRPPPPPP